MMLLTVPESFHPYIICTGEPEPLKPHLEFLIQLSGSNSTSKTRLEQQSDHSVGRCSKKTSSNNSVANGIKSTSSLSYHWSNSSKVPSSSYPRSLATSSHLS